MKKITLTNFKSLLLATCMMLTVQSSNAQIQKGGDIDGEAAGDQSGRSVSMPDANTLAIGAYYNDGAGFNAGHVRVYNWSGTAWVQKGADIDGKLGGDNFGGSVSMPDANTIAIGAYYSGRGLATGYSQIYTWNGTAWVQKGADIDGDGDNSGYNVSMPDTNTIAIGASNKDHGCFNKVRVYNWNGTAWVQKGANINGEAAGDKSGCSVSMPDANTIAIGAPSNAGNGYDAGHVRVYNWNSIAWVQKGADIDGEAAGDESGWSISMPDVNTLAIGTPFNSGNGTKAGHVRVYNWNGTTWVQKGTDIDGEIDYDFSGYSVSMPDANTIAIGAPNIFGGNGGGKVRIHNWNGTSWVQKGSDIYGETGGDWSGGAVSMPDANTIAIGAPSNAGNGEAAGHVRVYSMGSNLDVLENSVGNTLEIYPNPAKNVINVKTADTKLLGMAYSIYDNTGKVVLSGKITSENTSIELGNLAAGIYVLSIAENMKQTFKVIKK
jgi:hypothetical protein